MKIKILMENNTSPPKKAMPLRILIILTSSNEMFVSMPILKID